MARNWISGLAESLTAAFNWQRSNSSSDHTDLDQERMHRELELIRLRFQHHS